MNHQTLRRYAFPRVTGPVVKMKVLYRFFDGGIKPRESHFRMSPAIKWLYPVERDPEARMMVNHGRQGMIRRFNLNNEK